MRLTFIKGACGRGKTQELARIARDASSFLYVAPTRALAEQFCRLVPNARPVYGRNECNCLNFLVRVVPYLKQVPQRMRDYCLICEHSPDCEYLRGLDILYQGEGVVATTYALVMWHDIGNCFRIVCYDDIPFPFVYRKGFEASSLANRLKSPYLSRGRKETREVAGFPKLPAGMDETIVASAVHYPTLMRHIFSEAESITQTNYDNTALAQDIILYFYHLTMSADWLPPPGSCGIKKNTPPGLPYFLASHGLGYWRGVPLVVAGSFLVPLKEVYSPLLALLSFIEQKEYVLSFVPGVYVFDNANLRIPTGFWAVVEARKPNSFSGKVVIDLTRLSSDAVLELLGRSGTDITNIYVGDTPLKAIIGGEHLCEVAKIEAGYLPEGVVEFHNIRNVVANVIVGNLSEKKLTRSERRYYRFIQRILQEVNDERAKWQQHVKGVSGLPAELFA